jgi:DNA-binding MarR family transcriptional regulator
MLTDAVLTASRVLVGVAARSLAQLNESVTVTQFRVLVVLDQGNALNLARLAELLVVTPSSAMRTVDRLLVAGLVTRNDNPTNRREVMLGLTDEGRAIVQQVTTTRRDEIAQIVSGMPAPQRGALVDALRSFASAADEPEPSSHSLGRLVW